MRSFIPETLGRHPRRTTCPHSIRTTLLFLTAVMAALWTTGLSVRASEQSADVDSPCQLTLYVPGEDGLLHRQEMEDEYSVSIAAGEQALEQMLLHNPGSFPAGSRPVGIGWNESEKLATVNLNREFARPDFWQGSTRTLLGIYAIVNSLVANLSKNSMAENEGSVSVQILIEGEPVEVMGEFYARDPIEPDCTFVAQD